MIEEIYSESFGKLLIDKKEKIMIVRWQGKPSFDEYKFLSEKALLLGDLHDLNKWLSDSRKGKDISLEIQQWMITQFIPRAMVRFHKVANLLSVNAFRAIASKRVLKELSNKIPVRFFSDNDEAMAWLLE